ncbi:MAG TPA: hypothetical protein VFB88_16215 [Xanthobacteraceae bacterium]|nr:hypothetical protein [Xanthobacteraceae bacterium]
MSRLVRVPRQATDDLAIAGREDMRPHRPGAEAQPAAPDADNYLERIAKYVPGEVLAFFVFINVILEQAVKTGGKAAAMAGVPVSTVALGALLVGLVLTPLFVWYVREEGDAWVTNACVSAAAFPFWAYALGAVAFNDYWDGNLAAIMLATFTVVSGLISPPRTEPPQSIDKKASPPPTRTERPHLDLIGPTPA